MFFGRLEINAEKKKYCFARFQQLVYEIYVIKDKGYLANAEVSARQQCVYEGPLGRNLWQLNTRNIMLKSTCSGLQCYRWQYTFKLLLLPKSANSAKSSENLNL